MPRFAGRDDDDGEDMDEDEDGVCRESPELDEDEFCSERGGRDSERGGKPDEDDASVELDSALGRVKYGVCWGSGRLTVELRSDTNGGCMACGECIRGWGGTAAVDVSGMENGREKGGTGLTCAGFLPPVACKNADGGTDEDPSVAFVKYGL